VGESRVVVGGGGEEFDALEGRRRIYLPHFSLSSS
jgi:hypothetical protein